ncbi:GDSL-like lipase/acylhydrolase family protein [Candidatus Pelagibacter ubique]|uniref:GDSL-like lipase/acylhydrolase family protein n=1 Tax=Pelagibacter ubique TaxID=198252 RepID=A0ABX1T3I9_PELUQ|nr:SGNH/GDSL hydrolase family protein [Candidatus Pelagibacter ubique]NMN67608.1 GDSL-like lipase/acylhydrolase family protein [Candidatus Pelagibacter ubique]
MEKKNKKITKKLLIFSKLIFFISFLFSLILFSYSINRILYPPEFVSLKFYSISLIFSIILIIFIFTSYKYTSDNNKINISLILLSLGITFYTLEVSLIFLNKSYLLKTDRLKINIKDLAKQTGKPYDDRDKIEVIDDLIESGYKAYPNINPLHFADTDGFYHNNKKIYPLGSIAKSLSVLSNETGIYTVIKTDRFGFNNPDSIYQDKTEIIAMIGDSFVEGYASKKNEDISAVLRNFNLNVINLGKGGSGPLIEMAILREYALPLRPKIVLWFFYMNDLSDLKNEMKSSTLKRYYYDKNFSQNLRDKQSDIDEILEEFIISEKDKIQNFEEEKSFNFNKSFNKKLINFIKLSQSRKLLELRPKISPVFKNILSMSKQNISEWGGKMYFVYLPPLERYSKKEKYHNLDEIFKIVKNLDIPIIDIHKNVFKPHPNPLSLFPFEIGVHYNSTGYKLIGEAIRSRLLNDRIINK